MKRAIAVFLTCLFASTLVGCRDGGGVERYQVSGQVTYAGKPLMTGEIRFEPDDTKGNSGPMTRAQIVDSRYVTPKDKGVIPGPVRVTIAGYKQGHPKMPGGTALFLPYETSVEIPEQDSTFDFDVPGTQPRNQYMIEQQ